MGDSKDVVPPTPLPFVQLLTVYLVECCEGIEINILFPFLVFMVEDLGYGGSELGYYAGGLAASFCGAQFVSSLFWGRFSDMYGRKLAIFLGTFGAAFGIMIFGTAKTYTQAILGRVIGGLLCGNLGVCKSFITENTDETNRSKGFSYFYFAYYIGTTIAPILGGFLCKPAEKYPSTFSQHGIFAKYPYLLPCFICFLCNVSAAFFCLFVMKDKTKISKKNSKSNKSINGSSSREGSNRSNNSNHEYRGITNIDSSNMSQSNDIDNDDTAAMMGIELTIASSKDEYDPTNNINSNNNSTSNIMHRSTENLTGIAAERRLYEVVKFHRQQINSRHKAARNEYSKLTGNDGSDIDSDDIDNNNNNNRKSVNYKNTGNNDNNVKSNNNTTTMTTDDNSDDNESVHEYSESNSNNNNDAEMGRIKHALNKNNNNGKSNVSTGGEVATTTQATHTSTPLFTGTINPLSIPNSNIENSNSSKLNNINYNTNLDFVSPTTDDTASSSTIYPNISLKNPKFLTIVDPNNSNNGSGINTLTYSSNSSSKINGSGNMSSSSPVPMTNMTPAAYSGSSHKSTGGVSNKHSANTSNFNNSNGHDYSNYNNNKENINSNLRVDITSRYHKQQQQQQQQQELSQQQDIEQGTYTPLHHSNEHNSSNNNNDEDDDDASPTEHELNKHMTSNNGNNNNNRGNNSSNNTNNNNNTVESVSPVGIIRIRPHSISPTTRNMMNNNSSSNNNTGNNTTIANNKGIYTSEINTSNKSSNNNNQIIKCNSHDSIEYNSTHDSNMSDNDNDNDDDNEEMCCDDKCCQCSASCYACYACYGCRNSNNSNNNHELILDADHPNSSNIHINNKTKKKHEVLFEKKVMLVTINYGIVAMCYIILDETLPLFLKLDISQGGMSFNSSEIGALLSISAGTMMFFTLIFLPKLSSGSKYKMFNRGILFGIPLIFAWPLYALLYAKVLLPLHNQTLSFFLLWIGLIFINIVKNVMATFVYTAIMIQVNNSVVDEHLGAANGFGQSLASLARCIGPALGGIMWSISLEYQFIYTNFLTVVILSLISWYINRILSKSLDYKKISKKHSHSHHHQHQHHHGSDMINNV